MYDRKEYLKESLPIESELKILFSPDRPLTIFEIGACEGEDSIKYSRFFPNALIYAFEPLPSNADIIEKNLKRYNVGNVKLNNIALSDKKGESEFYVSSGNPANIEVNDWDFGNKSSSLLAPDLHHEVSSFIKFNEKIKVETNTLDSFCSENNIREVDFIHMDVQGAELMVLKGSEGMMASIKAIWLEVSKVELYKNQPLATDIEKFMKFHGFAMVKDCLYNLTGDRLYISLKYFPNHKKDFPVWKRKRTFFSRIMKRIGF
ncbi:MAG: FkbM family methyltransferase [Bacteroidota bacterium]